MIPVSTRQEIYDYLSEQLCEFSGAYYIEIFNSKRSLIKFSSTIKVYP